MITTQIEKTLRTWACFQDINRRRRATRDFSGASVSEDDIRSLLSEAGLAPSSGNLQPFQMHWIRNTELKVSIASACNGQRAATSAATLVVVTASPCMALITARQQMAVVEASSFFSEKSKAYYRKQMRMFSRIAGVGSWAIWTPLVTLAALLKPCLSLLPLGTVGSRNWAARNAIFAAQTLMLAASAKGIDSCPMEGFSAAKIAGILNLPRGTVIPVVVALGYRAADARVEPQWRRPFVNAVVVH